MELLASASGSTTATLATVGAVDAAATSLEKYTVTEGAKVFNVRLNLTLLLLLLLLLVTTRSQA